MNIDKKGLAIGIIGGLGLGLLLGSEFHGTMIAIIGAGIIILTILLIIISNMIK